MQVAIKLINTSTSIWQTWVRQSANRINQVIQWVNSSSSRVTAGGDYTVGDFDSYVGVTTGAIITLATPTDGRRLIIKDESGNASVEGITVVGTIDGKTNYVIQTDYGAVDLVANGSAWFISSIVTHVIIHTATHSDDHAFEICVDAAAYGDVKALEIQYETGALATGSDEAIILVNIDETSATGGDIVALEVLATDGGADEVWGMRVGATVGAIDQQQGVFSGLLLWDNNGTDETSEVSGVGTSSVFVADNDYVIVTSANKFEEIEIELDTGASATGIIPTFEYSTGGSGFTAFSPIDGTSGFRFNGIIAWKDSDISSWATNTSGNYEIRIVRTRNTLATTPIVDTAQLAVTTPYYWDKNGDVNINNLETQGDCVLNLPTSAGATGTLWSDSGTVKVA